jgi:hypothetical protein
MYIEVLNKAMREISPNIDLSHQIHGRLEVDGMQIMVHYLLGDLDPVNNLLRAFSELRNNVETVASLMLNGFVNQSDVVFPFVIGFGQSPQQQDIFVSTYGSSRVILLPPTERWTEAGLTWLLEMYADYEREHAQTIAEGDGP